LASGPLQLSFVLPVSNLSLQITCCHFFVSGHRLG